MNKNTACKLKISEIKTPRDYQVIAINKSVEGLLKETRGQLILPCGTGKTLISLWIYERLNPNLTLVLFPSLALLRQTKNEWISNSIEKIPYLCVCSEKDINKQDDLTFSSEEIGGIVSSDSTEIADYLKTHKRAIVFSTYQSLERIAEAIKNTDIEFDLAICDEAHKTSGVKQRMFGLVHDNNKIKIKKRLYMTATRRVISEDTKKLFNEDELNELSDMNDPNIFGRVFHEMSFREAIERGILVDYKVVAIGISNRTTRNLAKNYGNEVITNIALNNFMKEHGANKIVTFHANVKNAETFQNHHRKFFKEVPAFHVNGSQTSKHREIIMREFEGSKKAIITNARCLTEGIDIPCIDGVYFVDPKSSRVDIVQAAGRALRKAAHVNKQFGFIIVPVFHSDAKHSDLEINESEYSSLINVAKSFATQGENIEDFIKRIVDVKTYNTDYVKRDENASELFNSINIDEFAKGFFNQILSEGKPKIELVSYQEFKEFCRSNGIDTSIKFNDLFKSGKRPQNIPSNPCAYYKDTGWKGWWDIFGKEKPEFVSYQEFKEYCISNGIDTCTKFNDLCKSGKRPKNIPGLPRVYYKNKGWKGWNDINGKPDFLTLEGLKEYCRSNGIDTSTKFNDLFKSGKRPQNIPSNPSAYYKDTGWKGWNDITGKEKPEFVSYQEFKEYCRSNGITTQIKFITLCKSGKRPENIPSSPYRHYKDTGWKGLRDIFGKEKPEFVSFEEFKEYCISNGIDTSTKFNDLCKSGKRPKNIPSAPNKQYKDKGWKGWNDFVKSIKNEKNI